MFDFFAMAIAVVALIVARKTFNQAAVLRAGWMRWKPLDFSQGRASNKAGPAATPRTR